MTSIEFNFSGATLSGSNSGMVVLTQTVGSGLSYSEGEAELNFEISQQGIASNLIRQLQFQLSSPAATPSDEWPLGDSSYQIHWFGGDSGHIAGLGDVINMSLSSPPYAYSGSSSKIHTNGSGASLNPAGTWTLVIAASEQLLAEAPTFAENSTLTVTFGEEPPSPPPARRLLPQPRSGMSSYEMVLIVIFGAAIFALVVLMLV